VQVSGKPVATSVGLCFIAFAVLGAVLLMPGAKESQSPLLYLCLFGGLFVGVPAILGIAVFYENLYKKSRRSRNT
jgi:hypothetical protein